MAIKSNGVGNCNNISANDNNNNFDDFGEDVAKAKNEAALIQGNQPEQEHLNNGHVPLLDETKLVEGSSSVNNRGIGSSKMSTLQRQASHIQQALVQRIRRSSSFRAPTSRIRSFFPSFMNGKRKVSRVWASICLA